MASFGDTVPEAVVPTPKAKAVRIPHVTTVDVETFGIEGRPSYPPKIVGVSIKPWGKKAHYYSFGHPTGNNCNEAAAKAACAVAYKNADGILFQNSKFDIDCIEVQWNLKVPAWSHMHDTMFMLYLDDPHAKELGLKPAAERLLGMAPEERDAVCDWLVKNQPVPGVRISPKPGSKEPYGKYIAYAPGDIVGPYANGDTIRTEALFKHLYQSLQDRGMLVSYDRERKLVPILLEMERDGIRVDLLRLQSDIVSFNEVLDKCVAWIRKRLKVPVADLDFNFDSAGQLLKAMQEVGCVDVTKMGVTKKTGRVKTDKAAMKAGVTDKLLAAMIAYASQLQTCLRTFMEPWERTASKTGGLIFTNWNQTRGDREGGGGTRTGRFSSSRPNFQNIPKEFEAIFRHEMPSNKELPICPIKGLPSLPLCRGYIVPHKAGHVLVGRDYSQQEPRILAHFEDSVLMAQYIADPWIDYHDNAKFHIDRLFGKPMKRKNVKTVNLGIIYGQGVASLAERNGESVADTRALRDAIYQLYPSLKEMNAGMKTRARMNQPIRTWGGREYYCEPPKIIEGKYKTFDYKMVNVLVQGSAADCTKEGLIRFHAIVKKKHNRGWLIVLQVHDEIVISVPAEDLVEAQEALRAAMESVEFDVQILSEGSWSATEWNGMRKYDVKGKIVEHDLPKQRIKELV